jgi:hypothetical protein
VLAGLGIESNSLCVQKEGADLTLVHESVKVAINGGETDPRQFFVNPLVDLMGKRVSVITLESFEHLLQLACHAFAGGSPHRLTSNPGYQADRIEPLLRGIIKLTVSCQAMPKRPSEPRWRRKGRLGPVASTNDAGAVRFCGRETNQSLPYIRGGVSTRLAVHSTVRLIPHE